MARIRTIKPEFWTNGKVVSCSLNARLLFIGLWNFADDEGRLIDSPREIKMRIFPGDDFTALDVHEMLTELSRNDLISRYAVKNQQLIQVIGWDHQKINRANPSRLAPMEDAQSVNTHPLFTEPHLPEGKGREGKGREGKGRESIGDLEEEFESWWQHAPRKVGKGQARRAFTAARKKASLESLIADMQAFAQSCEGKDPQFIAHPATWLNGERWLDETGTPGGSQPNGAAGPDPPAYKPHAEQERDLWRMRLCEWLKRGGTADQWLPQFGDCPVLDDGSPNPKSRFGEVIMAEAKAMADAALPDEVGNG